MTARTNANPATTRVDPTRSDASGEQFKTSLKAIDKVCASIKATGGKLNALIQEGLVLSAIHAKTFGDVMGCAKVLDSITMTVRRNEAVKHLATYTPIRLNKSARTGKMTGRLQKEDSVDQDGKPNYTAWDIDGLKANNWFEAPGIEREPGLFSLVDFEKDLLAFVDRWESRTTKRRLKDGEDLGPMVPEDQQDNIRHLVASVRASVKAEDKRRGDAETVELAQQQAA